LQAAASTQAAHVDRNGRCAGDHRRAAGHRLHRLYPGLHAARAAYERDDLERQLLELPQRVRLSGYGGILTNRSADNLPDDAIIAVEDVRPPKTSSRIGECSGYPCRPDGVCGSSVQSFTTSPAAARRRGHLRAAADFAALSANGTAVPSNQSRCQRPLLTPRIRGFTLIETLVALVILAASLLAFYEFLAGALNGAAAVERAATAYDRRESALALASILNPMATPEGNFDLGAYRIHCGPSASVRPAKQRISIRQGSVYHRAVSPRSRLPRRAGSAGRRSDKTWISARRTAGPAFGRGRELKFSLAAGRLSR